MKRFVVIVSVLTILILDNISVGVDFKQVARTGDTIPGLSSPIASFGHWISINDQGQVAFKAKLNDDTEAIVRATPKTDGEYDLTDPSLWSIVETANGSTLTFGDYVSINANGQTSYRRKSSAGGVSFTIRRDVTRVAFGTSVDTYNWYFRGLMQQTDISTKGQGMVSFYGDVLDGYTILHQIRKGDSSTIYREGGKKDTILIATQPTFSSFNRYTSINNAGHVLFTTNSGIYVGEGGTWDTPGPIHDVATIPTFSILGKNPTINNLGKVAFYGETASEKGIYIWQDGQPLELKIPKADPIESFEPDSRVYINDIGDNAFIGITKVDNSYFRTLLFMAIGETTPEIISRIGENINGSPPIGAIELWNGLNNLAGIAFWVLYDNNTEAIWVADVPETICSVDNVHRLPQGRGADWAECGLGKRRTKMQTKRRVDPGDPEQTWERMHSEKGGDGCLKTVGLRDEENDANFITNIEGCPDQQDQACNKNVLNQWCIKYKGCVLTSATVIANTLLGYTDNDRLTPMDMNEKLIFDNWGPLITNEVVWSQVGLAIADMAGKVFRHEELVINRSPKDQFCIDVISSYICSYNVPVAVRVNNRHTVVAYEIEEFSYGRRIRIADPSYKDYEYLDKYAHVNKINVIFPWNSGSAQILMQTTTRCPAEMILTDSHGRRLGYDPRTGEEFIEIPNASYSLKWENYEEINEDPNIYIPDNREEAKKIASIYVQPGEIFNVQIIGTEEGQGWFTQVNMGSNSNLKLAYERNIILAKDSIEAFDILSPLPGDFNLDGKVDAKDLLILKSQWLHTGPGLITDIHPPEGDEIVNLFDLSEFASYWLEIE